MAERSPDLAEDALEAVAGASEGEDLDTDWQDENELACQGVTMLLNNEWEHAQELFVKHKDVSPLMCSGSSFVNFLQALMTFEDEKLAEAMKGLQETEKRCESSNGFIKNIRKKFGNKKKSETVVKLEDRLQRQTLVADSILYQAVLTFINQDLTSFVKGGWLLRKAWKVYEKTYREIQELNDKCSISKDLTAENSGTNLASEGATVDDVISNGLPPDDVVARLLGAVSFGFGTLQLCISMVPPKILKIIEFLGFEGDRCIGLEALEYTSHSKDMKAPLASLGLLWYHTVIRPFFALDGTNVDAGVEDAMRIMERCEKEYPHSSLFLFFKGRAQRLQSQIEAALTTYKGALDSCGNQREIQLICLHEIGWCQMMRLNWKEATKCFMRLKEDSRWSKSYYAYLTAVCQGAMGDVKGSHVTYKEVPSLIKRKNNQIEIFVLRRAEKFRRNAPTPEHCILLALEVLYLWNALPTCTEGDLRNMLEACNSQTDKKVFHLRSLIEGALYREMYDEELSKQCYEEAIARHQGMKEDSHVAAYAMYEIGCLLAHKPEGHEQSRKYFMQAKENYKDYDFENRLSVRIHNALKRLKTEGTPV